MTCSFCRSFRCICRHCRANKYCPLVNDDIVYLFFSADPLTDTIKNKIIVFVQIKDNGAVAPLSQNSDILSPINRQNVGQIVQPKMPIYIFKIERHGGVPLRAFTTRRWHTNTMTLI